MTETAKLEALKPCPFCLNELSMARDYDGDPIYTHPDSENCVLSGTSWDADCFDVKAWNSRALSVSRPAVKGLEWEPVNDEGVETEEAHSILPGSYRVFADEDSAAGAIFAEWAAEAGHFCMTYAKALGRFYNWDEAKAAAQSDFEQRVLSSLVGGADVT